MNRRTYTAVLFSMLVLVPAVTATPPTQKPLFNISIPDTRTVTVNETITVRVHITPLVAVDNATLHVTRPFFTEGKDERYILGNLSPDDSTTKKIQLTGREAGTGYMEMNTAGTVTTSSGQEYRTDQTETVKIIVTDSEETSSGIIQHILAFLSSLFPF